MTGETLITRLAIPADAEEISLLLKTAFAGYRPLYTDGGFKATTPSADEVQERLAAGPCWICANDVAITGTVCAKRQAQGLYVYGMAVHPEFRNHKIAQRLIEETEKYAANHFVHRLFLSTTPFLAEAIALYQKVGFVKVHLPPFDLHGTPLFTMEKFI